MENFSKGLMCLSTSGNYTQVELNRTILYSQEKMLNKDILIPEIVFKYMHPVNIFTHPWLQDCTQAFKLEQGEFLRVALF